MYLEDTFKFLVTIALLVFLLWLTFFYTPDPVIVAQEAAQAEANRVKRETPFVIRSVDGCQVYQFHANDRTHYFTRCVAGTTETETQQYCGKSCYYKENIVTENIR